MRNSLRVRRRTHRNTATVRTVLTPVHVHVRRALAAAASLGSAEVREFRQLERANNLKKKRSVGGGLGWGAIIFIYIIIYIMGLIIFIIFTARERRGLGRDIPAASVRRPRQL